MSKKPSSSAPVTNSITLDDSSYACSPSNAPTNIKEDPFYAETSNYKQDEQQSDLFAHCLEYFKKHPSFSRGLLTAERINKLCNVIERNAKPGSGVNKKQAAFDLLETLGGRPLTAQEKNLVSNTIEFMHNKGMIRASFWQRLYTRLMNIFR